MTGNSTYAKGVPACVGGESGYRGGARGFKGGARAGSRGGASGFRGNGRERVQGGRERVFRAAHFVDSKFLTMQKNLTFSSE